MSEADQANAVITDERWAAIPGFEGLYEVSSLGRARSLPRKTASGVLGGHDLSPSFGENGYARITLSKDGKKSRLLLHRAVLLAFVGECPSGEECRHLDGKRANCRLSNLAWGTKEDNAADRLLHGTQVDNRGERHGMTRLSDTDAKEIYRLRQSGLPLIDLAKQFSTSQSTVSRIANGQGWKHIQGASV